jgi:predicted acyltransferase
VIVLLAGLGLIAALPAVAAIITGLIALSKRRNNSRGSRALAIIGLILVADSFCYLVFFPIVWRMIM